MTLPQHVLSLGLDSRLVAYAAKSWNTHEAVYGMQRVAALLPVYCRNLEAMFGPSALGEARRFWGVLADLAAVTTGLPPTYATLSALGFREVERAGYVIPPASDFTLATLPTVDSLPFEVGAAGDLRRILRIIEAADRAVRPLHARFQDELRAYDFEAAEAVQNDHSLATLGDLVRLLPDEPKDFPVWDGRPLFLHEQKSLLDYLLKGAAIEILAQNLVDDVLGQHLLRLSGLMFDDPAGGAEPVLDIESLPPRVRTRPALLVAHSVGKAALGALRVFDPQADELDRLYVVEMAIKAELGIDVSRALEATRNRIVDQELRIYSGELIDIARPMRHAIVRPYEFPELGPI